MYGSKRYLDTDVLTAARARISVAFDMFERVYVAFSGGKDSTVLLELVAEEARHRQRKIGLLFVDLEAQYKLTVDFVGRTFERHADVCEPFWLALPISLRNAVSAHQSQWIAWDPTCRDRWVREPPSVAVTDAGGFPWFRFGMEFEDLVDDFGSWYAGGVATCCFVGIRTDESLNRFRTIASDDKERVAGLPWTTRRGSSLTTAYPIYDWRIEDIWRFHAMTGAPYNGLYDVMHAAGLSLVQMRICQPYGDDQRKGLWLYHVIEPETWVRVVSRVAGVNSGALFSREHGNVNGVSRISLPPGHTWESFARLLLDTLPPQASEHYRTKVDIFVKWYATRGYPDGIPDAADTKLEAAKKAPSWRRVCKTILRNDWWCKGLGFAQHRSGSYDMYMKRMQKRRAEWASMV